MVPQDRGGSRVQEGDPKTTWDTAPGKGFAPSAVPELTGFLFQELYIPVQK